MNRVKITLKSLTLVNLSDLLGGTSNNTSGHSFSVRMGSSSGDSTTVNLLHITGDDFSVYDFTNHLGGLSDSTNIEGSCPLVGTDVSRVHGQLNLGSHRGNNIAADSGSLYDFTNFTGLGVHNTSVDGSVLG